MNDGTYPTGKWSRPEAAMAAEQINKYSMGVIVLGGLLVLILIVSWLGGPSTPANTVGSASGELTETATTTDSEAAYQPYRVSVLDVLGKLGVAVLCVYGVILGLRWWRDKMGTAAQQAAYGDQQLLNIRQEARLGENDLLYVVELGNRVILIGQGEGQLSVLADLPAEEVVPEEKPAPAEEGRPLRVVDLNQEAAARPQRGLEAELDEVGVGTEPARRGEHIRAQSQRAQEDWPARRDALIRALQEAEG